MKGLLIQRKLEIPEREIAVYQYYKIHYKKLREYGKEHHLEDYIDGMQCFTSKDYLYVLTATGKEEVYQLGATVKEITDTDMGTKFIKNVTNQYSCEFPEFLKQ